jgi:predicted membrane channel-forming protein YqfA (hemolysin III family)
MLKKTEESLRTIANYVFQSLLFLFLVVLLLQQFFPLEVASALNINWFMLVVIVIGALSIFFPPKKLEKRIHEKTTKKDYAFIILLGLIGFLLIKIKTAPLGWLSWAISILGGTIIILLSIMVLEEDEQEN